MFFKAHVLSLVLLSMPRAATVNGEQAYRGSKNFYDKLVREDKQIRTQERLKLEPIKTGGVRLVCPMRSTKHLKLVGKMKDLVAQFKDHGECEKKIGPALNRIGEGIAAMERMETMRIEREMALDSRSSSTGGLFSDTTTPEDEMNVALVYEQAE